MCLYASTTVTRPNPWQFLKPSLGLFFFYFKIITKTRSKRLSRPYSELTSKSGVPICILPHLEQSNISKLVLKCCVRLGAQTPVFSTLLRWAGEGPAWEKSPSAANHSSLYAAPAISFSIFQSFSTSTLLIFRECSSKNSWSVPCSIRFSGPLSSSSSGFVSSSPGKPPVLITVWKTKEKRENKTSSHWSSSRKLVTPRKRRRRRSSPAPPLHPLWFPVQVMFYCKWNQPTSSVFFGNCSNCMLK